VQLAYGFPFHTAPPHLEFCSGEALATLAHRAEDRGFDAAFLTEHPAPSQAWREAGGHDALDPFVGLGLVAGVTTHLRLLTYLTVVPYRNPFLLAKAVATLDRLSGGRVELGMGSGYMKGEFAALGVDFDERNALFDEALEVMVAAFTGKPVAYAGRRVRARGNVLQPTPVQQPHPPFWFGGNSRRTLRRVVDHAGGWMPLPNTRASARHLHSPPLESLDDLAALLVELRRLAEEAGSPRPPVMYCLPRQPDLGTPLTELVGALTDLGVTWVSVNGEGKTMGEALDFLDRSAEALRRAGT
jgi:probable F420-dependent oxidoreductase